MLFPATVVRVLVAANDTLLLLSEQGRTFPWPPSTPQFRIGHIYLQSRRTKRVQQHLPPPPSTPGQGKNSLDVSYNPRYDPSRVQS